MKKLPSFLLAACLLFAPIFAFAQSQDGKKERRERPDQSSMTREERLAAINQRIEEQVNRYREEMGEHAPTEDQLEPFLKLIASNLLESMKLRNRMMQARQNNKGNNREAMMAFRTEREKLDSEMVKGMKQLLDKAQFKAFKKAKEKVQPQPQRRGPGGGGGGRGPGGGGGAG